ncbi:MAG: hypothetical protein RQ833_08705 [Sphingomonadaceae bacterium]|nr:hypothetical protein [Sphingomonadaceae bacterium]
MLRTVPLPVPGRSERVQPIGRARDGGARTLDQVGVLLVFVVIGLGRQHARPVHCLRLRGRALPPVSRVLIVCPAALRARVIRSGFDARVPAADARALRLQRIAPPLRTPFGAGDLAVFWRAPDSAAIGGGLD